MKINQYISDQELLEQLKVNNQHAFNELYNRYWEHLFRSAFYLLQDEASAKDIVQDIFLTLWQKREKLKIESLKAYLSQAVKYQVAHHLKKGRLTLTHEEYLSGVTLADETALEVQLQDLNEQVKSTLKRLPDKSQEVFYLSRFQNLSNQEIAQKLNISIRTVEWHISSALKLLRSTMGKIAMLLITIM